MKTDAHSFATLMLQARCVLLRMNPLLAVALALLLAGLLCVTLWVPHIKAGLADQQEQLRALQVQSRESQGAPVAALSDNELRMQKFVENLGENGYAEQQLKTLFDIAAKKNLKLNAGQYKSTEEKNSETVAYQIELPVSGPYPAIREFCEEVLATVPFASLDEISFKREAISKNNLDANLRFTLYLSAKKKVVQP